MQLHRTVRGFGVRCGVVVVVIISLPREAYESLDGGREEEGAMFILRSCVIRFASTDERAARLGLPLYASSGIESSSSPVVSDAESESAVLSSTSKTSRAIHSGSRFGGICQFRGFEVAGAI